MNIDKTELNHERDEIINDIKKEMTLSNPLIIDKYMAKMKNVSVEKFNTKLMKNKLKHIKSMAKSCVIPVTGILATNVDTYLDYEIPATSYDDIKEMIEIKMNDANIDTIYLYFNSPGGSLESEILTLSDYILECRNIKPIIAIIDNMCASAAYWIASQCSYIFANKSSEIGSIGVYQVLYDFYEAYKSMGIDIKVARSGEYKGIGLDAITERQMAIETENIMEYCNLFIEYVANGRGVSSEIISKIANGRTFIASKSLENKLIDGIISSDYSKIESNLKIYMTNNIEINENKDISIMENHINIDETEVINHIEIPELPELPNIMDTETIENINDNEITSKIEDVKPSINISEIIGKYKGINDTLLMECLENGDSQEIINEKMFNYLRNVKVENKIEPRYESKTSGVAPISNEIVESHDNSLPKTRNEMLKKISSERGISLFESAKVIEKEYPQFIINYNN